LLFGFAELDQIVPESQLQKSTAMPRLIVSRTFRKQSVATQGCFMLMQMLHIRRLGRGLAMALK